MHVLVRLPDDVLRGLSRVAAGWLLAALAGAASADVRVQIVAASDADRCLAAASLVATSGEKATAIPLRGSVASYHGALPARLELRSEGCWSGARDVATGEIAVELHLHRAGTLAGTFQAAHRPSPLSVSGSIGEHALVCSADYPRWTCRAPAGLPLDLVLAIKGYASIRYWDVVARPGETVELEPRELRPGASLSGVVHDPRGKPLPDARLVLFPLEAHSPAEGKQAAARLLKATTNRRGFFEFTGLGEGVYRVVSRVPGFSPAILPKVELREGEALAWPRALTHVALAKLTVLLDPPLDPAGKPWNVELSETEPLMPGAERRAVSRPAVDGRWEATDIGADVYDLRVETQGGSVLDRRSVDLSAGGASTLPIIVSQLLVHGTLTVGHEPLEADLRFSNGTGTILRATSSDAGTFEVAFPGSGRWSVDVQYPRKRSGARVHASPVEIRTAGQEIEVRLPGGRIRGSVVSITGTPERAAVHVTRNGSLVVQQVTEEDGTIELIGLEPGSYALDAEGQSGTTAHPVDVPLAEDEMADVKVVLEPWRLISGTVFTPNGMPASGASVRISPDGGTSWWSVVTDVEGRFERHVSRDLSEVQLVAVGYGYPAAIVRVPPSGTSAIAITLGRTGGVLRARNAGRYPSVVAANGVRAGFPLFYFPPPWGEYNGGIYLEPGSYRVCADGGDCRSVSVAAGGESIVDFEEPSR
jgi:hypothetical protein